MDVEQEYSAKAAADRAERIRQQRKRNQAARARSAQPIEQPEELAMSVAQLAAALGANVKQEKRCAKK